MDHHRRGLRRLLQDDLSELVKEEELLQSLEEDWRNADISEKHRAMLDFSFKLTATPWDMEENDVENLRHVGFTDRDILDIVEVVFYYAYANRVADGLGISVESWIPEETSLTKRNQFICRVNVDNVPNCEGFLKYL